MRKIVMFNRVTLNGYFAGPSGEIDWFIHDPEVDRELHASMDADTMLLGRVTYQMFAAYWPHVLSNPEASSGDRVLAQELNQMTKVVFSTTIQRITWENTMLLQDGLVDEARKMKEGEGGDIVIFGSGTVVKQLTDAGLIDEHLIVVTPVILEAGMPLFEETRREELELVDAKGFATGNVLLHYRVVHPKR
jgi:dihydrofolate reductase